MRQSAYRIPSSLVEEQDRRVDKPRSDMIGYLDRLIERVEECNLLDQPVPERIVEIARKLGAPLEYRPTSRFHPSDNALVHDALMELCDRFWPPLPLELADDR